MCFVGAVSAQQKTDDIPIGIKSILLGESYGALQKDNFKCTSNSKTLQGDDSSKSSKRNILQNKHLVVLNEEFARASRIMDGDVTCSIRSDETIAGMKITSLIIDFYKDRLGKITINFAPGKDFSTRTGSPRDKRSPTYDDLDFVVRNSVNREIAPLLEGLKDRYGPYKSRSELFCGRWLGGCRDAPLKVFHQWAIGNHFIKVEYLGASYKKYSFIEYTSSEYLIEHAQREFARAAIAKEIQHVQSEASMSDKRTQHEKNVKDL